VPKDLTSAAARDAGQLELRKGLADFIALIRQKRPWQSPRSASRVGQTSTSTRRRWTPSNWPTAARISAIRWVFCTMCQTRRLHSSTACEN
jgi:hypothetical protein